MARQYILKHTNKALFKRIGNILLSYNDQIKERNDILLGSPLPPDGMPRGNNVGRPTENKALRLAQIDAELYAIDQSIIEMQGELSGKVDDDFDVLKAYWNYAYYDCHKGGCEKSWNNFKHTFSYKIAKKLNLI